MELTSEFFSDHCVFVWGGNMFSFGKLNVRCDNIENAKYDNVEHIVTAIGGSPLTREQRYNVTPLG